MCYHCHLSPLVPLIAAHLYALPECEPSKYFPLASWRGVKRETEGGRSCTCWLQCLAWQPSAACGLLHCPGPGHFPHPHPCPLGSLVAECLQLNKFLVILKDGFPEALLGMSLLHQGLSLAELRLSLRTGEPLLGVLSQPQRQW